MNGIEFGVPQCQRMLSLLHAVERSQEYCSLYQGKEGEEAGICAPKICRGMVAVGGELPFQAVRGGAVSVATCLKGQSPGWDTKRKPPEQQNIDAIGA